MKPNLLFSLFFFTSVISSAQWGCNDPEAWNYFDLATTDTACFYPDICENGTEASVLTMWVEEIYLGAELFVTSTNGQDTIATHTFYDSGITGEQAVEINFLSVCMDPDSCYYGDLYLPFETDDYDGTFTLDSSFLAPYQYLQYQLTDQNYVRFLMGSEVGTCGVLGCTDSLATNYSPLATVNYGCEYCDGAGIILHADYLFIGSLPFRIKNDQDTLIQGTFHSNFGNDHYVACLDTGCYELEIYGDPWGFSQIHATNFDGDTLVSMSLSQYGSAEFPFALDTVDCSDNSEVYGCTNPVAINYNPAATVDDGNCDMQNDECELTVEMYYDTLNQQIVLDAEYFATDYPIYVMWDMGDGTPLFESFGDNLHLYDSTGVFTVCAGLYSLQWGTLASWCYDEVCLTIDASEYGFTEGFPVLLQEQPVSVTDQGRPEKIVFYPNPSSDEVTIRGVQGEIKSLEVYTLDGRLVENSVSLNSSGQFSVADFSSGTYLVFIRSAESYYTGRLVVQ